MYLYIYFYIFLLYISTCIYHIYMYLLCIYLCKSIYFCGCVFISMLMSTYISTYLYAFLCIYVYIYLSIHHSLYTHACVRACASMAESFPCRPTSTAVSLLKSPALAAAPPALQSSLKRDGSQAAATEASARITSLLSSAPLSAPSTSP